MSRWCQEVKAAAAAEKEEETGEQNKTRPTLFKRGIFRSCRRKVLCRGGVTTSNLAGESKVVVFCSGKARPDCVRGGGLNRYHSRHRVRVPARKPDTPTGHSPMSYVRIVVVFREHEMRKATMVGCRPSVTRDQHAEGERTSAWYSRSSASTLSPCAVGAFTTHKGESQPPESGHTPSHADPRNAHRGITHVPESGIYDCWLRLS